MALTNAEILRIIDLISAIGNGQIAIEPTTDTDLGVKAFGYKDADGNPYKVLVKGEMGVLKDLALTDLAGNPGQVAVDANGKFIRQDPPGSTLPGSNGDILQSDGAGGAQAVNQNIFEIDIAQQRVDSKVYTTINGLAFVLDESEFVLASTGGADTIYCIAPITLSNGGVYNFNAGQTNVFGQDLIIPASGSITLNGAVSYFNKLTTTSGSALVNFTGTQRFRNIILNSTATFNVVSQSVTYEKLTDNGFSFSSSGTFNQGLWDATIADITDLNDVADNASDSDITQDGYVLTWVDSNQRWERKIPSLPPNPIETTRTLLLSGDSTAASQTPTGTGTANELQIEFGPAQGIPSDKVQLLVDGTIVFNQVGQYLVTTRLQFGRSTGTGVAELYEYIKIDGTVINSSVHTRLDDANTLLPEEYQNVIDVTTPGTTLTLNILRDQNGENDGGLYAGTAQDLTSNPSTSALVEVWQYTTTGNAQISTPDHNDLNAIQGGTAGERFHLTQFVHDEISNLSFEDTGAWSGATNYTLGDIAEYNGYRWIARQSNTNNTPVDGSAFWARIDTVTGVDIANKLDKVQTADQGVASAVAFDKGIQLQGGYFGFGSPQLFFGTLNEGYIHYQPNGDLVIIKESPAAGTNGGIAIRLVPGTARLQASLNAANNQIIMTEGDATTPATLQFVLDDEGGGKLYFFDQVTTDNSPLKLYGRGSSGELVEVDPNVVSSIAWGDITGILTDQTDVNLQSVTDNGQVTTNPLTTGDITIPTAALSGEGLKIPDASWIRPITPNSPIFITNGDSPSAAQFSSLHLDGSASLFVGDGLNLRGQISVSPTGNISIFSMNSSGTIESTIQLNPGTVNVTTIGGSNISLGPTSSSLTGPGGQSLEFTNSGFSYLNIGGSPSDGDTLTFNGISNSLEYRTPASLGVVSFTNPSTLTPDASTTKQINANALSQALTINIPTNPTDGAKVIYKIRAASTSTLTWSASFNDLKGSLPTSASINKTIYVGVIYDAFTSVWDVVSVQEQT